MSFKPQIRDGKTIGFSSETEHAYFFFGTRHFERTRIAEFFPRYTFAYLKQVHGRATVPADPSLTQEADAHFTSEKNLALVSQTADCTPVLLANDRVVCAIHSGWRGTAQNIVAAAKTAFPDFPPLVAAIGPHILKSSFEIGTDVAGQLLKAAPVREGLLHPHPAHGKTFFDLTELVRHQLRDTFGAGLEIREHLADTFTDELFHSFRRERERAGRQFSFVVLKA